MIIKRIVIIKRVLGTLISLNLLPVICGIINKFTESSSFLKGFLIGYLSDAIIISIVLLIILLAYLFGIFE